MTAAGLYAAYGLRVRSEVPLPHFGAAEPGEADVEVRLGAVPRALPGPARRTLRWDAAPGDFLLRVEDDLRCRVRDGREILVECPEGADSRTAAYLMGSAWTALLQQRGLLTLHASGVRTERGAVLFLGRSGAGKSTLAGALAARGFNVLTDDVAAVLTPARGRPLALPGYPNLRLWADAVEQLGLPAEPLRRARDGIDKYLLPAKGFCLDPQGVCAAYLLGIANAETLEMAQAPAARAFQILRRHTHRRRLVDAFGNREAHFRALARFARGVPVTCVAQPAGGTAPSALAERIERHLADVHGAEPRRLSAEGGAG